MVQGAVYDAVNMIDGGHHPYLAGLPAAPASASRAAAVATAAHDVLAGIIAGLPLTPTLTQAVKDEIVGRLLSLRNESIAAAIIQDGAAVPAGIAAGAAAANAMLDERANDGRYGSLSFPVGTGPGEWRPTPPGVRQRSVRLGRSGRSVPDRKLVAVPLEGAAQAEERDLCEGIQRGEAARGEQHADDSDPADA